MKKKVFKSLNKFVIPRSGYYSISLGGDLKDVNLNVDVTSVSEGVYYDIVNDCLVVLYFSNLFCKLDFGNSCIISVERKKFTTLYTFLEYIGEL